MNNRMYYSREAEVQAQRDRLGLALFILAVGLSIGTALALLFAPKSGDATRKVLADVADDAVRDGRDAVNKAVGSLQKDFERLRNDVEDRLKTR